ncbi:hypothetical protein AB0E59_01175 [Lentzea sp. NPDC034063]|uniref:hypothetical protein n=1 Tax=unclassified Lentzea TaxID=2643253 RepID=UPI00340EFD8A
MKHVNDLIAEWSASSSTEVLDAAEGGRDFLSYLAGDLESDLRAYLFRLEHGRYPDAHDQLPEL